MGARRGHRDEPATPAPLVVPAAFLAAGCASPGLLVLAHAAPKLERIGSGEVGLSTASHTAQAPGRLAERAQRDHLNTDAITPEDRIGSSTMSRLTSPAGRT